MTEDRVQGSEVQRLGRRFSGLGLRLWLRPHKQGSGFRGSLRARRSQFIAHSRMWSAPRPTLLGEKGVQSECMRSKLVLFVLELVLVLVLVNQNFIADKRRWTSTTTRPRTKAVHPTSVLCPLSSARRTLNGYPS